MGQIIGEVLEQIDGVMFVEPSTNRIVLRLSRAQDDGFAMAGRTNPITKVRVVYENREENYAEDSMTAQNTALALNPGDIVRGEVVRRYRVVKTLAVAGQIAARELAVRSRSLIKTSSRVRRSLPWGSAPVPGPRRVQRIVVRSTQPTHL
ncbi:MAG: hypothetical protein KIT31_21225 [Deltaproteobacteria bacterium]|nr:hypothetical protein [Deltaproteobacteria bacterium]